MQTLPKAERTTTEVVTEVPAITLTLNETQAEILLAILGSVGGSRVTSNRRHSESILTALRNAGVTWPRDHEVQLDGVLTFGNDSY